MGAIGNDELKKLENIQMISSQERIMVLVRLRPLSEKEITANEVADWECINDNTILYRNTLREGSTFPSAYMFDRVFRGDCSTRQVYEEGAKEIALSVVRGINSSIFAYGQTSSGKTYTMTGITEYTVADIFDYINKHEERAFILKFSAIEIYNEAIRDLLSTDNIPLRLRDDPEKGTIVEKVTEEVLRDQNHLKELLCACEAQRKIGETTLNEKSSRSHQIIRLVVESSAHEFLGKDNSTTLAASVNFVDLAGSERASQALSSGARLKEGCHINRSLLTLSTVVRKLSVVSTFNALLARKFIESLAESDLETKLATCLERSSCIGTIGRHGHINYRDSKLTRILQPCLGGNARTAIVCTLSPARSHVEQTRNTLLFACCAKEVTTKAQVNVVMSDKALVKHLQRELARLENELKIPAPPSNCDYVALLRKKDLQIQKMEKEIRELTKQRDLAQSRVEDLLKVVGRGQESGELVGISHHSWEDECAGSQTSDSADCNNLDTNFGKLNKAQLYDTESETNMDGSYHLHKSQDHDDDSLSDDVTSPLSNRKKFTRSNLNRNVDGIHQGIAVPDDDCQEVQCIEMEEAGRDSDLESRALATGGSVGMSESTQYGDGDSMYQHGISTSIIRDGERIDMCNGFSNQVLEDRLHSVQHTVDSLVSADEPSSPVLRADVPSSTNVNLTRSWSCREDAMTETSLCYDDAGFVESTPPNGLEMNFPGRPKGYPRKLWSLNNGAKNGILSRNNSHSSLESASMEDSRGVDSIKSSADEDITSIHTFVAGLKKQLAEGQVEGTGKNLKDVGVGPMMDASDSLPDWPLEFARQQKAVIELWQACHVSLVHRTYFFLLFKGDPSDSIYMEVELRRLSFLKNTLSQGNVAIGDGQTLTLASRALRREREMLSKLMRKRLSEEERQYLFQKWGISMNSKRRRLQLVNHLWSNAKDMNHITESAAIVAKLIRFVEQGQALKEMFGLSFTPTRSRRRSFGWKNSMSTLL